MIQISEILATEKDSPMLTKLPTSCAIDLLVSKEDIDGFGHANNARYIQWLDQVHWYHLDAMGISQVDIFREQCGFVVYHTDITYKAPLSEGDMVKVGTMVEAFDSSFRMTRKFQLVRIADETTALIGTIDYISVNLSTGKPKRLPAPFSAQITKHLR